ncbi:MAG: Ig-like domain-containing protein, partial [Armatimonadia bacterium]
MKRTGAKLAALLVFLVFVSPCLAAGSNKYLVRSIVQGGRTADVRTTPVLPPPYRVASVARPMPNKSRGVNIISNVPALQWCFGCSATSAAMMFGYYDSAGFPNMYTGPTNGGVFPQTNSAWPDISIGGETRSQCPLSATRDGLDGRVGRGHVDDYWIVSNNAGPDPWIANVWTQHSWGDCTGDYMGTNQSAWNNIDGSTTFVYWTDGTPTYDYTSGEGSGTRDGCHGMRAFAESRGATVETNFSQYIDTHSPGVGFTYAQYMAEIDAGRPVLIQVDGHTMLGVGYDDSTSTVYVHNTWDWSLHTMTWGGSYEGMGHYGVTVLRLQQSNPVPQISLSINGGAATTENLGVTLNLSHTGGGAPTEVRFANDAGGSPGTWTSWETWTGSRPWNLAAGDFGARGVWAQARNAAGEGSAAYDDIFYQTSVTVPETGMSINGGDETTSNLDVTLTLWESSGGSPTQVRFANDDGGSPGTWSSWRTWGTSKSWTLATGGSGTRKVWAQARNSVGTGGATSDTIEFEGVLEPTAPTKPTVVAISPTPPGPEELRATASGSSDVNGDAVTYQYQWSKKAADGSWEGFTYSGQTLAAANVHMGETWGVRARASDGSLYSGWTVASVTIVGMANYTPVPKTRNVPRTASVFLSFRWAPVKSSAVARVTLTQAGEIVPVTPLWVSDKKLKLTPRTLLKLDSDYRINIARGVRCVSGRVLDWEEKYAWFHTAPAGSPTMPTSIAISPATPGPETLVATASGATDPNGDVITYQYQWSPRKADGTFAGWDYSGETLPGAYLLIGETWGVRARAFDGFTSSDWTVSTVTPTSMAGYSPEPGARNIARTACVFISFRWTPVKSSVESRVRLLQGSTVVPASMTWVSDRKLKLRPRDMLEVSKLYRVRIASGVECVGGRVLNWEETHAYFTTAPATAPTTPTLVTISPSSPGPEDLFASAGGSTDLNDDPLFYEYQWSKKGSDGSWEGWNNSGDLLPTGRAKIGETWAVRARANDGTAHSSWKISNPVTITSMAEYLPAPGAQNVPRNASVFITFRWPPIQSSADSLVELRQGTTPVPVTMTWVSDRKLKLRPKSLLRVDTQYCVYIGAGVTCTSGRLLNWTESHATFRTAPATPPTMPTSVAISPEAPGPEILHASASGSTDVNGDTITYEYQWSRVWAEDGTWEGWDYSGNTLPAEVLTIGETWGVRARAFDGTLYSSWKSASVTITNMAGVTPAHRTYGVPVTTAVFGSFRWPVQQSTVTTR